MEVETANIDPEFAVWSSNNDLAVVSKGGRS
jgi:hypothetical protein